jgi:NAD(P)-dependent dehydrogenase (short-subunit alcohol dehydrogenase family)
MTYKEALLEIIKIYAYLCSENSSHVTGSNFVIDGGWTSW